MISSASDAAAGVMQGANARLPWGAGRPLEGLPLLPGACCLQMCSCLAFYCHVEYIGIARRICGYLLARKAFDAQDIPHALLVLKAFDLFIHGFPRAIALLQPRVVKLDEPCLEALLVLDQRMIAGHCLRLNFKEDDLAC